MNWEALSATCAAVAIIGGVFLWVIKQIVDKAVRDAIDGFKEVIHGLDKRLELLVQSLEALRSEHKELYDFVHNVWHKRMNEAMSILAETVKAMRH